MQNDIVRQARQTVYGLSQAHFLKTKSMPTPEQVFEWTVETLDTFTHRADHYDAVGIELQLNGD